MELTLSTSLLWTALLFYSGCFPPQIFTNSRIKSARGMSDAFIWCYFTGYLLMMLYVFGQDFAYPYQIMVPIETLLMCVLVYQRFYYDGIKKRLLFTGAIMVSTVLTAAAIPFMLVHGQVIATVAGWLALITFSINQVPQLIKIHQSKTTYGFSFLFVTFTAIAQVCELIGAIATHVPMPTLVMAGRGLLLYVGYIYFFKQYRHAQ